MDPFEEFQNSMRIVLIVWAVAVLANVIFERLVGN